MSQKPAKESAAPKSSKNPKQPVSFALGDRARIVPWNRSKK